jgi:hypothetical protein
MDGAQFQIVLVDEGTNLPDQPAKQDSSGQSPTTTPGRSSDRLDGAAHNQASHPRAESHPTGSGEHDSKRSDSKHHSGNKHPDHWGHVKEAGTEVLDIVGFGGAIREFREGIHTFRTIMEGLFAAKELFREFQTEEPESAFYDGAKEAEHTQEKVAGHLAPTRDNPQSGEDCCANQRPETEDATLERIAENTEPVHFDRAADKIVAGLSGQAEPAANDGHTVSEPIRETASTVAPETTDSIPDEPAAQQPVKIEVEHPKPIAQLPKVEAPAKVQSSPLPTVTTQKQKADSIPEARDTELTTDTLEPQYESDVFKDLEAPFKAIRNWLNPQDSATKTVTDPKKDFVFPPPVQKTEGKGDSGPNLQITRNLVDARHLVDNEPTKTVSEPSKIEAPVTKTQPTPTKPVNAPPPTTPNSTATIPTAAESTVAESAVAGEAAVGAESVAAGAAESLATAEAAAATTELTAGLTGLTTAVGATAAVFLGVAAVVAGAIVGLKLIGDAAREQAEELEEYSADISMAMAKGEVKRELHKIERADERGGTLATIVESQDKMSMAFEKLGESLMDPLVDMLAALTPVMDMISDGVVSTAQFVNLSYAELQLLTAYVNDFLNLSGSEAQQDQKVRDAEKKMREKWNTFFADEKKKSTKDLFDSDPMVNLLQNAWGQQAPIDKAALKQLFDAALAGGGGHH